jgi:hypothetical protein
MRAKPIIGDFDVFFEGGQDFFDPQIAQNYYEIS